MLSELTTYNTAICRSIVARSGLKEMNILKNRKVKEVVTNLFLLTAGACIFAVGIKAIAVHHGFITGGLFGTALLIFYVTDWLSPNVLYFIMNIPLFVVGYLFVGKRFFWYSLYATIATILIFEVVNLDFGIDNQLYAAIASGVLCGVGAGLFLKSLGSGGGLDVAAVMLNMKFNISFGKFYLSYNCLLFVFCFMLMDVDLCIASMILLFITSVTIDGVLSSGSQRKMVYIISEKNNEIANDVLKILKRGATFIKARGAFSGETKEILMTVVSNMQLKRLEEVVYNIDEKALFIVENTFSVLGRGFNSRKSY